MAIIEYVIDKSGIKRDTITINKSGFSISAAFIKSQKLLQKQAIKFYMDDEDIYWLGFEFFDETGNQNTLSLLNKGSSGGRQSAARIVKAAQLFSKSELLKAIKNDPDREVRTFEVKKDKRNGKYYINLKPCFENRIAWEERNKIDSRTQGIYRYLDKDGNTIYIGKGIIKERAISPERKSWGVKLIEFSEVSNEEDSVRWEHFYISQYEKRNGRKPIFNLVSGVSG